MSRRLSERVEPLRAEPRDDAEQVSQALPGEPLEVVGKVLPLSPTASRLPWAVENLRFCTWCDQLAQRDLNECPTCGRRMDPLPTRPA